MDHTIDRSTACIGCRACEEACLQKAVSIAGEKKSIEQLLGAALEDRDFYRMSDGGVTLGGGEVSAQPEAALSLLQALRQENIHTAIETCGYMRPETLKLLAGEVDLFLYDIKHIDSELHYRWTGVRNDQILENLKWLFTHDKNVRIRMPLLKGINDDEEYIIRTISFLLPYKDYRNFKGVDLLPYHRMGVNKYRQLGMDYPMLTDPVMQEADLDRIKNRIEESGIAVTIVRH